MTIPRHDFQQIVHKAPAQYGREILPAVERYGGILLQNVDPASDELLLGVAREIGSLDLGIDPELVGPTVMDLRYDQTKVRSAQRPAYFTADHFGLHTDLSYVTVPPRFLLMHCVHPDPGGGGHSLLADCTSAFMVISHEARSTLSAQIFSFAYPPNCPIGESEVLPVYEHNGTRRLWRFRLDSMKYPERATTAVEEFASALVAGTFAIQLARGDLLVLDNHRMVHGRTAFVPFESDQPPRHLRRVYARDLTSEADQ